MAKKKNSGLGKGLDALFGEIETIESETENGQVQTGVDSIDINDIKPNKNQPRKTFSEESLGDLASSIKEHGVIQPIIVRPSGDGYEIVAGERRWRAARIAGLKSVPCLVRELSDRENMLYAIIENMQREDLNPIEEARGLSGMISEYVLTQEQVSASVGKSRPYIANSLRLLKLPEAIQEKAADGSISAGHARALLQMNDEKKMIALAEKIEKEGLSVRETEAIASGRKKTGRKRGRPMEKNADVLRVEEDLKAALGTKVSLKFSGKKGKIEIECYSKEEMDRIVDLLREI